MIRWNLYRGYLDINILVFKDFFRICFGVKIGVFIEINVKMIFCCELD